MGFSVWHGDADELRRLIILTEKNEAKQAMLDQRFLDGLLFARWQRDRLLAEEWLRGRAVRRS